MSNNLLKALHGAQGELDAWLEVRHESQVREAILALIGKDGERKRIAANESVDDDYPWALLETLAGTRPSGSWESNPMAWFNWTNRWQSAVRVAKADALLAELSKGEPK